MLEAVQLHNILYLLSVDIKITIVKYFNRTVLHQPSEGVGDLSHRLLQYVLEEVFLNVLRLHVDQHLLYSVNAGLRAHNVVVV